MSTVSSTPLSTALGNVRPDTHYCEGVSHTAVVILSVGVSGALGG